MKKISIEVKNEKIQNKLALSLSKNGVYAKCSHNPALFYVSFLSEYDIKTEDDKISVEVSAFRDLNSLSSAFVQSGNTIYQRKDREGETNRFWDDHCVWVVLKEEDNIEDLKAL